MATDHAAIDRTNTLPTPARSSRWRWSTTSRSAALCGGALMGALAIGGVAGASTTHTGQPPAHGPRANGQGMPPTAGGKITALSGDDITLATRGPTKVTVVYSASTTFTTPSGSTAAADLKVGQFITVQGATASNGDVTATTVMISTGPPGNRGDRPGRGGPPKGGQGPAE